MYGNQIVTTGSRAASVPGRRDAGTDQHGQRQMPTSDGGGAC